MKTGLSKTRKGFVDRVEQLVTGRKVDEELFEELEELLIQADVGVPTAVELVDRLRDRAEQEKITEGEALRTYSDEITTMLKENAEPLKDAVETPYVIMVVGVNGAGKTTTIGSLPTALSRKEPKFSLVQAIPSVLQPLTSSKSGPTV